MLLIPKQALTTVQGPTHWVKMFMFTWVFVLCTYTFSTGTGMYHKPTVCAVHNMGTGMYHKPTVCAKCVTC